MWNSLSHCKGYLQHPHEFINNDARSHPGWTEMAKSMASKSNQTRSKSDPVSSVPQHFLLYTLVFQHRLHQQDYSYRHCALFFLPASGRADGRAEECVGDMYHVQGAPFAWRFEARQNDDPFSSVSLRSRHEVGHLLHAMTRHAIHRLMRHVPVRNADPEFNCLQWVNEALQKLVGEGLITAEQYEIAMDATVQMKLEDTE
ncbi:hypothetical protein VTK73DRAFT_7738 [Phialemonium thermophilum]|uniref:Uncharacterized protein n=1 Tax=Phialemonium thermophilum TaxID=223376 RepID=A0ABR3WD83_9PEZI